MQSKELGGALTVLVGGLLVIVGSFLPWITATSGFGSVSVSGMDHGGDGIFTLVLGVIAALIGMAQLIKAQLPGIIRGSPAIIGVSLGVITFFDHSDIRNRIARAAVSSSGALSSTVGQGIWSLYLGAVLIFIGGISLLGQKKKVEEQPKHRECPHCKMSIRADASVCPHCQRESPAWRFHNGFWWMTTDDGRLFYLDKTNQWAQFEFTEAPPA